MGKSLKQQLAERPDTRERDVTLQSLGGEPITATIRRVTVAERDRWMQDYKVGTDTTLERGAEAAIAVVQLAVVPVNGDAPLTKDDIGAMPATLVDELARAILDFNGWTKGGKAALDDQFRPAAGSAV